jgi:hypothetical protein
VSRVVARAGQEPGRLALFNKRTIMTKVSGMLLAVASAVFVCGSAAYAQDEYCNQHAQEICGGNQTISQCFEDQAMWRNLDPSCTATVQTIIENEHEAMQQQDNSYSLVNLYGQSYGGALREGPSANYAQVGTIHERDSVEILEDPNVWYDGYKWLKVRTPQGVGYHWGGRICIPSDTAPSGVFSNCN